MHRGAPARPSTSRPTSRPSPSRPITVVSRRRQVACSTSPATLERLETLSVPVVGYRTTIFPSFWLRESGYRLDWSVDNADRGRRHHASAGRARVTVRASSSRTRSRSSSSGTRPSTTACWPRPSPPRRPRACAARPSPRSCSASSSSASGGRSLEVNLDLARNNVRVAAEIATAWSPASAESVTGPHRRRRRRRSTTSWWSRAARSGPTPTPPRAIRPRPGGSAANTAAWLGSLGAAVDFVGRSGQRMSRRHEQVFRDHGVEPHLTVVDRRCPPARS